MTKTIIILLLFIITACSTNKSENVKTKQFDFVLFYNGPDTIYSRDYDTGTYKICLLPIINNLSKDTVVFIKSIYGRHNRQEDFTISPKFGINIYKDNKKIDFDFMRGCFNFGYLNPTDFVTVLPNKLFLPFQDSNETDLNFDFTINAQIPVKGEIEIEAYYNTLDTCQRNYHPFTANEMKIGSKLIVEEYQSCRELFKKLPHVNLTSNRIKVYLK